MTARIRTTDQSEKVETGWLVSRGLAAGVLATIANLLVYFLVPALFNISLEIPLMGPGSPIQPLPFTMVILGTLVPTAVAIILMVVLNRFTSRPVTIFRIIAVIFLLLSFVAPFSLPVPLGVRITLASMHLITAAIIVTMLTSRASAD